MEGVETSLTERVRIKEGMCAKMHDLDKEAARLFAVDLKESGVCSVGGVISPAFYRGLAVQIAADQGSLGSMMPHAETNSWDSSQESTGNMTRQAVQKSNQRSPSRLSTRSSYLNKVSDKARDMV